MMQFHPHEGREPPKLAPNPPALFPVYVTAPGGRAEEARAVHERLCGVGCAPVSQWASLRKSFDAIAKEGSESEVRTALECRALWLERARAMIVLTWEGEGDEQFAELGSWLGDGKRRPVLWTGPRLILSAYDDAVHRCSLERAIAACAFAAERVRHGQSVDTTAMRLHRWCAETQTPDPGTLAKAG